MTHRQTKLPFTRRIIAAGCVMLWLAGISACNLEALVGCASHGDTAAAHPDGEHSHNTHAHHSEGDGTHHSPEAEGDSHGSPGHGGKNGSCCATLHAVAQAAKPVVFSKPVSRPIAFLCVPCETHVASLACSGNHPNHQAKPCDWVFTPRVCLGPAHRSIAPPSLA